MPLLSEGNFRFHQLILDYFLLTTPKVEVQIEVTSIVLFTWYVTRKVWRWKMKRFGTPSIITCSLSLASGTLLYVRQGTKILTKTPSSIPKKVSSSPLTRERGDTLSLRVPGVWSISLGAKYCQSLIFSVKSPLIFYSSFSRPSF